MKPLNQYSPVAPFFILGLFLFALGTCQSFESKENPSESEQAGIAKSEEAAHSPVRIVSAGGAITETIYALGLGHLVAGVDTSSVYPKEATKLPKVGYQRRLSAEGVLSLNPTVVVVSDHAGPPEALEQIRAAKIKVVVVTGKPGIDHAYERVLALGEALGAQDKASALVTGMKKKMSELLGVLNSEGPKPKVLSVYARGQGSVNVAGKNSASSMMITMAGGENAVRDYEGYRPISAEAVIAANPDYILIPARGLDSLAGVTGLLTQPGIAQTTAGKNSAVIAIDDLMLLGFGPRTPEAVTQLARALNTVDSKVAEAKH